MTPEPPWKPHLDLEVSAPVGDQSPRRSIWFRQFGSPEPQPAEQQVIEPNRDRWLGDVEIEMADESSGRHAARMADEGEECSPLRLTYHGQQASMC